MWNAGDYAGCAAVYKRVVKQFAYADDSLATAVLACEGKSTDHARTSQVCATHGHHSYQYQRPHHR